MKELIIIGILFLLSTCVAYKCSTTIKVKEPQCTMDTIHIKEIISYNSDNKEVWEPSINFFVSGENIARAEFFWRKHKILPSVYLAHAALETGYGTSSLVKKTNNRGNIKTKGEGIRAYDKIEKSNDKYAIFPSYYEGEKAIIRLFKRFKDIRKVLGQTDYKVWTEALEKSPYSTDPKYAEKLNSIIQKFSLYELDHAILREDLIVNFEGKVISYRI